MHLVQRLTLIIRVGLIESLLLPRVPVGPERASCDGLAEGESCLRGAFEGSLIAGVVAENPCTSVRLEDGQPALDSTPSNGESIRQLIEHQARFATRMRTSNAVGDTLIVGHGWALWALVAVLIDEDLEAFWQPLRDQPQQWSRVDQRRGRHRPPWRRLPLAPTSTPTSPLLDSRWNSRAHAKL